MAKLGSFVIFTFLLVTGFAFAQNSTQPSPSPAPSLQEAAAPGPALSADSPQIQAPISLPPVLSPPAPGPADQTISPAPEPSDEASPPDSEDSPMISPTPAPTPSGASDINHSNVNAEEAGEETGGGGMSGSKKAGIAVGVLAAACVVGIGGCVYKKRQDNLRRAQYGYAARRDLL